MDYIIETTAPAGPCYEADLLKWRREIVLFSQNTDFAGLDVIRVTPKDTVTFRAVLVREGVDMSFTEVSTFILTDGRWFYHSGSVK